MSTIYPGIGPTVWEGDADTIRAGEPEDVTARTEMYPAMAPRPAGPPRPAGIARSQERPCMTTGGDDRDGPIARWLGNLATAARQSHLRPRQGAAQRLVGAHVGKGLDVGRRGLMGQIEPPPSPLPDSPIIYIMSSSALRISSDASPFRGAALSPEPGEILS
jgi:hypothetical protein